MNIIKKLIIILSAALVIVISIYRLFNAPDIVSMIFFLIIFIFFSSFLLFLIFEKQLKTTRLYKKLDDKYFSKKVPILGQEIEFPYLVYLVLGSQGLSILFVYSYFTGSIPFDDGSIMLYLFYVVFLLFLIVSIYLTFFMIRHFRNL